MRVSERLIGFAHQNHGSLSNDDCDAILYYIKDLQREITPYCSAHHAGDNNCAHCGKWHTSRAEPWIRRVRKVGGSAYSTDQYSKLSPSQWNLPSRTQQLF